jgi:hypothetical protein
MKNETYARTTQYEYMMDRHNQQKAYVAEIRVMTEELKRDQTVRNG